MAWICLPLARVASRVREVIDLDVWRAGAVGATTHEHRLKACEEQRTLQEWKQAEQLAQQTHRKREVARGARDGCALACCRSARRGRGRRLTPERTFFTKPLRVPAESAAAPTPRP